MTAVALQGTGMSTIDDALTLLRRGRPTVSGALGDELRSTGVGFAAVGLLAVWATTGGVVPISDQPTGREKLRVADDPVPAVKAASTRLLLVGDSFLEELILIADEAACPPLIDYWFYMRNDDTGEVQLAHYFRKPGEPRLGARLAADLAQLPESFAAADAVVLEENEATVGKTKQIENLLAAARARGPEPRAAPPQAPQAASRGQ